MRAIRAQDEGHEGDEGDEGGRGHEIRAMRAMRSRRDEGDEDDDEGDGRQLGGFDDGGRPACGFPAAGAVLTTAVGLAFHLCFRAFSRCSPRFRARGLAQGEMEGIQSA